MIWIFQDIIDPVLPTPISLEGYHKKAGRDKFLLGKMPFLGQITSEYQNSETIS